MNEDSQLLRQYAEHRSEPAFRELVARHLDLVYSVALRQMGGDHSLAQDIAQTVFIDLARKAKSLPASVVLAGWLCRHTFFVASTFVRSEHRRRQREQETVAMNIADHTTGPDWERLRPHLDKALQDLAPADRDAIVLRYFQGRDLKAVGNALGLSEDAAQKRVARALGKMRDRLARRGITLATASLAAAITAHSVTAAPLSLATHIATAALSGTGVGSGLAVTWIKWLAWTRTKSVITTTAASAVAGLIFISVVQHELLRPASRPLSGNSRVVQPVNTQASAVNASQQQFGFHWSQVESADYRQYMANLRAIGCPEGVIQDLIIADVSQAYAEKAKSVWDGKYVYWKHYHLANYDQHQKLRALWKERWSVIKELLGNTVQEGDIERLINPTPRADRIDFEGQLLFLPEPKQQAALKALRESGLADTLTEAREAEYCGMDEYFEEQVKVLASVLSPDELEEYRLRNSPKAEWLRNDTCFFDLTPEEFKQLFALREKDTGAGYDTESVSPAKAMEEVRALFGEAAAQDYAQKSNWGYRNMRTAAESAGLPADLADRAGQIGYEACMTAEPMATNTLLSVDERLKQLARIQQNAIQRAAQELNSESIAPVQGMLERTLENLSLRIHP